MHKRTILVTALLASAAFGQAPAEPTADRVLHFTHTETARQLYQIATAIGTIADMKPVPVDEAQKSLSIHGTPAQVALAEWLFVELDQPVPAPQDLATHEYRLPGGGDDVVRVFRIAHTKTVQEFVEAATMMRTIADIGRIFTYNETRAMVARGTAGQIATAEWLSNELEKHAGGPVRHAASSVYRSIPASPRGEDVVRVFYAGNAETIQGFVEMATLVRTIADIRQVFTYNPEKAVAVRGTADQLALAEWLFDQIDRPAQERQSRKSAVYRYQLAGDPEDSIQIFYLPHTATPQDFQQVATKIRAAVGIRRAFAYNPSRALAVRGTLNQVEQAQQLLTDLDRSDSPRAQ